MAEPTEEDLNLEKLHIRLIKKALFKFPKRFQQAAALGISEKTLHRRIKDYNIEESVRKKEHIGI